MHRIGPKREFSDSTTGSFIPGAAKKKPMLTKPQHRDT
jgi:hypothetical protein